MYVNVAVLVALRRSAQVWVRSYVDLFLYVYVLLDQYSYPDPVLATEASPAPWVDT